MVIPRCLALAIADVGRRHASCLPRANNGARGAGREAYRGCKAAVRGHRFTEIHIRRAMRDRGGRAAMARIEQEVRAVESVLLERPGSAGAIE